VLTQTSSLRAIREHYRGETQDLMRIVLNATSVTEANLALQLLSESVPEKVLVATCNLREVLASLPSSPFSMRVDEPTLARTAGMEKRVAAMEKTLSDGLRLILTTAGNLVLDVIIKRDDEKWFWNPVPVTDDYVTDGILDTLIESDVLLDEMLELVNCMGVVMNPKFYCSLEDWHFEYAADVFEGIGDIF
jgi:hypothetical protein